jgi:hypothetical protein
VSLSNDTDRTAEAASGFVYADARGHAGAEFGGGEHEGMLRRSALRPLSFVILLLLAACGPTPPSRAVAPEGVLHGASRASGSGPRAIALVPLYSYPKDQTVWQPLVDGHAQTPAIPIDAIVDVTNLGPGKKIEAAYSAGVAQLHAGGIAVLGYVDTARGKRALSAVENDIANWKSWYAVDGIFLDVMPDKAGQETYYTNATTYAKSLGLSPVIGNPGTDTSQSYAATVDALVIWEDGSYPTLQYLSSGWFPDYDRSHFAFIAYDQASLNTTLDDEAEQYVLYEYVTNGKGKNPYAKLPPYLNQFLSTL